MLAIDRTCWCVSWAMLAEVWWDAGQVVVDAIDPRCLVSGIACHTLDFASTSEADLQDICMPLSFPMGALQQPCRVGAWFV